MSSVLVLFRAAVSAIVSFAVLLTVYFVQLLSFYCKFEQIKIDWLIDSRTLRYVDTDVIELRAQADASSARNTMRYYNDNVLWDVSNASFINLELKDAAW